MSSQYSMYVVPSHWTLKDCMVIAYMTHTNFMLNKEEFKEFMKYEREMWDKLYDEIVQQPSIYCYTSTDGDPDFNKIMDLIPLTGRLLEQAFPEEAYELVKELKTFCKKHNRKRYICLN